MNPLSRKIIELLNESNLPVTKQWLYQTLESHPDFPTLLSVQETLATAGIGCIIHQIEKNDFENVSLPALFHVHTEDVILIKTQTKLNPDTLKDWTGVILNIDKSNLKLSASYKSALTKERKQQAGLIFFLLLITSMLCLSIVLNPNLEKIVITILSLSGFYFSWNLFLKESGKSPQWVNSLCSSFGNGCDKILSTTVSKGFLGITLTDLAALFFILQVLTILSNQSSGFIYIFILLGLPVTVLSIFYQKFILKNWCALCLGVCLIIWLEYALISFNSYKLVFPFTHNVIIFFICLCASLLWFFIKTAYKERIQTENIQVKALSKSRNPYVFNFLLNQQEQIKHTYWNDGMAYGPLILQFRFV